MVWQMLEEPEEGSGSRTDRQAAGDVARAARARPANRPDPLRAQCVAMRDFVVRIRHHTAMQFAAPVVRGLARRIAAAAELEVPAVRLAPPRLRSERAAQRYRSAARRAGHPAISRPAPGSRAALGRRVGEGSRRRSRSGGSGRRTRRATRLRSRGSPRSSPTRFTSRNAAAISPTIRRIRAAC